VLGVTRCQQFLEPLPGFGRRLVDRLLGFRVEVPGHDAEDDLVAHRQRQAFRRANTARLRSHLGGTCARRQRFDARGRIARALPRRNAADRGPEGHDRPVPQDKRRRFRARAFLPVGEAPGQQGEHGQQCKNPP